MTEDSTEVAPTGVSVLDGMLGGGLPRRRSVLLTGSPGTGKSTLAMQFLQTGLENGENCLYVSTEQTVDELRESFGAYEFDLDHDNLTFASIHAAPGQTLEEEGESLTLQTLGEDGLEFGAFSAPFTGEYVQEYLDRFAPCDRVVFDSASGLAAISDSPERYRRTVLDLIRFFSDEFGATSVFTAELHDDGGTRPSTGDVLQFTTHGVIRLSRETVDDDMHRFLEIVKLRGVDHDTRRVEVEFDDAGIRVAPARRSQPPALKDHAHRPIGIRGLDDLTGGGLAQGAGVLLEHDGRANLNAVFAQLLSFAVEADFSVTLVPTIELRQNRVERLLAGHDITLQTLFDEDRLFVVDVIGAWNHDDENVFAAPESAAAFEDVLTEIKGATDRPDFALVNAGGIVHSLGANQARALRYFVESRFVDPDDMLIHALNPATVDDQIGAFYRDAAEQVLDTWIADDGLQYVTLRKSPCGFVGSTSLVEYTEEPPYLRVQQPPQTRDNPYRCE